MFLSNILYQLKTDVLQFQDEANTTRASGNCCCSIPYMVEKKQMQHSVCIPNMLLSVCICYVCNGTEEMFVLHKEEAVCMERGVVVKSHKRKVEKEGRERERERELKHQRPVNTT